MKFDPSGLKRCSLACGVDILLFNDRVLPTAKRIAYFIATDPMAFERSNPHGHVTASAFLMTPDLSRVLLTLHKKLDRWLQLGGHCDGERDPRAVALREAREESGLDDIEFLIHDAVDVDIHEIPASKNTPAHPHYDVRFLLAAESHENIHCSAESLKLSWVPVADLENYTNDDSILRLRTIVEILQNYRQDKYGGEVSP